MLYILIDIFQPNNAVSNRLLGYIKAIDEMNINATVVVFLPNKNAVQLKKHFII